MDTQTTSGSNEEKVKVKFLKIIFHSSKIIINPNRKVKTNCGKLPPPITNVITSGGRQCECWGCRESTPTARGTGRRSGSLGRSAGRSHAELVVEPRLDIFGARVTVLGGLGVELEQISRGAAATKSGIGRGDVGVRASGGHGRGHGVVSRIRQGLPLASFARCRGGSELHL